MSEFFPSLPSPVATLAQFPPERIYGFAEGEDLRSGTKSKEQLARAYNISPYELPGGIVAHETFAADGRPIFILNSSLMGHDTSLRIRQFNPNYPTDTQEVYEILYSSPADSLNMSPNATFSTGEGVNPNVWQLADAQDRVRNHMLRKLGASGVLASLPAYEVASLTHPLFGVFTGLAGLAACGMANAQFRGSKRQEARKALLDFGDWIDQPENGAIAFPMTYNEKWEQRKAFFQKYDCALTPEAFAGLQSHLEDVRLPHLSPSSFSSQRYERDVPGFRINPAKAVVDFLRRDKDPAEAWVSGLSEMARAISSASWYIVHSESALHNAEKREKVTGVYSGETDFLKEQMTLARHHMLETMVEMDYMFIERRAKQRHTSVVPALTEQFEQALNGMPAQPHPLELHIQAFHGVARDIFENLNWKNGKSFTASSDLTNYLQDVRRLLTHPGQSRQFYDGLRQKFQDIVPAGVIPEWEEFAESLPVLPT